MRYHASPGSIVSRLVFIAGKGINLGWRKASLRQSKQPRKAALPVSHFGILVSQRFGCTYAPTKADAVKPSIFSGKISLFVIEKAT
jgi:hypothetical protein